MIQTKTVPASDFRPSTAKDAKKPTSRIAWVDNLRMLTILLVVNMHAGVTYSHVGSWYYNSPHEPSLMEKLPFALWQGHLQSFFMGLLFFIGGYFADRSLERKSPAGFLKERMIRLGLPTLFYMLVIHPFVVFVLLAPADHRPSMAWYLTEFIGKGRFIGSSGPMWFAFALLLFCIPFAWLGKAGDCARVQTGAVLQPITLLILAMALSIGSFLVRTVQPIGTSILNFQLCFFTQYIVAFVLGIVVSRRDCLQALAQSQIAKRAGWIALIGGPAALIAFALIAMKDMGKAPPPMYGGWNWEALALATWEQSTGIGLALGAMALCSFRFNSDRGLMRWLSDRSFGVYLLHTPVLVGLALLFDPIHANLFGLVALLTVTGWIGSFAVADIGRRLRLV
ncbi:MAG: acyltransferase [Fimbriimonas sp.]|nr:acyltransferase [Fimbriimonas sp.]